MLFVIYTALLSKICLIKKHQITTLIAFEFDECVLKIDYKRTSVL